MKGYILNTPILTDYGTYEFTPLSLKDAQDMITYSDRPLVSAIGHEATALVCSTLLHTPIAANRIAVKMEPKDIAIVFRLLERLPEGVVLTETELLERKFEFGFLVRTL